MSLSEKLRPSNTVGPIQPEQLFLMLNRWP